ncbi:MAG TPA: TRAP transporter substrate-binding protein DctP [Terrimesophilobacter sp.]|nr:TRAP transporter substrate-binding protein DctP [Terrimesophilobacter sp.]
MKTRFMAAGLTAAVALGALTGCATQQPENGAEAPEQTFTMRLTTFSGDNVPGAIANERWAELVEERSDGRLKVDFFYAGSLLSAQDTLAGVGDGRADAGWIAAPYYPADLPLSQVAGVPFVTSNPGAQTAAFADLYESNDAFRAEWDANNVTVLHFQPATEMVLGMRAPLDSIDDLQGVSIRSVGYASDALLAIGANPVAIGAADLYDSIERGVVEGYAGFAFDAITGFGLENIAPYTVSSGLGNYILLATVVNNDWWAALPDDLKQVVKEVDAEFNALSLDVLVEANAGYCDIMVAAGAEMSVLPDAEQERWRAAVGDSISEKFLATAGSAASSFWDEYLASLRSYESQYEPLSGVAACMSR